MELSESGLKRFEVEFSDLGTTELNLASNLASGKNSELHNCEVVEKQ